MMSHINDAIERTSRLLGISPDEALSGILSGTMPMFKDGGAVDKEELYGKYAD